MNMRQSVTFAEAGTVAIAAGSLGLHVWAAFTGKGPWLTEIGCAISWFAVGLWTLSGRGWRLRAFAAQDLNERVLALNAELIEELGREPWERDL